MVFSKALLALPLLLSGVSAMFNATSDDFLSVYRHNKIKIPAADEIYSSTPLDAQARDLLERATQAQAAPHWTIYQDRWIAGGPPPVANVKGFNAFYLSFLLTAGPWDMAQEWVSIGASARATLKAQYQAAGIKLMVAAFGATDAPTSAGQDPVALANTFANFVKTYSLDGIDIDYEDFNAFAAGTAENWLISFTTQLRSQLPASAGYIITHAPVAPWFTPSIYPGGGYLKVHRQVGSLIDWYNIQFYNQGSSEYTTCNGLLTTSSATWPQTAVFQIGSSGVPLDKIVIGKPATTADANNGFMDASTLAGCLSTAKGKGWTGGAMVWQYPNAAAAWIKTVRSSSWPV